MQSDYFIIGTTLAEKWLRSTKSIRGIKYKGTFYKMIKISAEQIFCKDKLYMHKNICSNNLKFTQNNLQTYLKKCALKF